jgi:protein-S-isoprenylcysteine O-methyltransferase Ste14
MDIDRLERAVRVAGAVGAAIALASVVPAIVQRSAAPTGRTLGRQTYLQPAALVAISAAFALGTAAAWRDLPVLLRPYARGVALGVGAPSLLGGLALYISGRQALGGMYDVSTTAGVRLRLDHRLVTTGPYGVVRHPMYLGAVAAAVGALLVYRTWTTVLLVALTPVWVVRAQREESALAAEFGAAWEAYCRRVPGWIPGWL